VVPDDLLAVLDHLKIQRAHLVGHSFWRRAALDFALLHPDRVASLVLVSAPPNGLRASRPDEVKQSAAIFAPVKDGDDAILKAWMAHSIWSALAYASRRSRRSSRPSPRGTLAIFPPDLAAVRAGDACGVDRLKDVTGADAGDCGRCGHTRIRQARISKRARFPAQTMRIVKGAASRSPHWVARRIQTKR
jgi:pimeloyl-ACP methyl ester carboxylesterase